MINHNSKQDGFTLLMTLIVVSVVVSVGLTILDLSIKQLKLSTISKDSEIAFHAANAGLECAQYNRENKATEIETGADNVVFNCFGDTFTDIASEDINFTPSNSNNGVYKYEHEFTWGETGAERCTEITTVALSTGGVDNDPIIVAAADMRAAVPGYPETATDKRCEPGALCTVVSVRGYSRSCADKDLHGVIQREVLLEF